MQTHFQNRILRFTCLATLWAIVSCAPSPQTTASKVQIVGGHVPDQQSPAATSTVALIRNNIDGDVALFCSGTLIAPNLVVTAAHCVEGFRSEEQFSVVFGRAEHDESRAVVPVAKFKMFKKEGSKFFPNFDIAWVKLAEPAPEGYHPVEIFHDGTALKPSDSVRHPDYLLAGYGLQSTTCREVDCVGTKLEVATLLREPLLRNSRLFSLLAFGNTPGSGSCNGDSGGSAFALIGDKWYLIGATNGITSVLNPAVFTTSRDRACEAGQSLYTFIGDYAEWIEKTSGVKLSFDARTNPRFPLTNWDKMPSPAANASFAAWFAYPNHEDPAWYTTDRIALYAAMQHRPETSRAVFLSPQKILETFAKNPQFTLVKDPGDDDEDPGTSSVFNQQLQDVRPLATLPLKKLDLRDHQIADYSPLRRLKGLETLVIRNNVKPGRKAALLFDTGFVSHLTKLHSLDLSGTHGLKTANIDWKKFKALRELRLDSIGIVDIKFIEQLPALELLSLRRNRIRSIAPLAKLKNLKILYLAGNPLTDVSLVNEIPSLEVCDLPDTTPPAASQNSAKE